MISILIILEEILAANSHPLPLGCCCLHAASLFREPYLRVLTAMCVLSKVWSNHQARFRDGWPPQSRHHWTPQRDAVV